jgi:protease-4
MKKFLLGFVVGLLFAGLSILILGLAAVRLGERRPTVEANSTLILHLEGDVPEQAAIEFPIPLLQEQQPLTLVEAWQVLKRAAADSRIKNLVIEPRGLSAGWGKLEELRADVAEFKKSGKPVYAYLRGPDAHDYYVATAADKIFMAPEDLLDVKGLRAELMYFKGTLDKLGISMEFEHVGKYKDAPDQFTRESPRPETLEVTNQILDQYYGNLVNVIAQGRHKDPAAVRAILDDGPYAGRQALERGLLDGLLFEEQILPNLRDANKVSGRDYAKAVLTPEGRRPRIAFVTASGDITRGETSEPVPETGITARAMVRTLRQVEEDSSIKGVIFRIDSPGGDGIASDDILHELKVLSAKKPLIISMSDLAASGGYLIAMTGNPIIAYPNTLTGSIGVFYGRVNLKGLFDKIGITETILTRGKFAAIDSVYGPLSPAERAKLRQQIELFYKSFVDTVAAARKRTYEQINEVAQGRVWLGEQAKQRGLVDELGGLDQALEMIKRQSKIQPSEQVTLVTYPPRRTLLDLLFGRGDDSDISALIRPWFGRLPIRALEQGGILRLMPYMVEVK